MQPADVHAQPTCRGDDPEASLPELVGLKRPRLRPDIPILWRTSTSVQIGDRVTVSSVTRALVSWMTSLDGSSSSRVIAESLTIPENQARRLLRALLAAGALDDAARLPAAVRWATAEDRPTEVGRFAATFAAYRDLDRAHAASRHRSRRRVGVIGETLLADRVRESLSDAGLVVDDHHPHLTVLAEAHHPDVPVDFDHPAMTRPHLFVATYAERGAVGPLVVPGRTGCLRCRHLHRRDADPAWPVVAVQWSHAISALTSLPIDPLLARMAADWTALMTRTWVDLPREIDTWGGWRLEISLPLGDPRVVECPPHPLCGCRWDVRPPPPQDERPCTVTQDR